MTTRKHRHDAPGGEPREPATASLEAKIAELESAVAEAIDRSLRLAADLENYKKRARQEQMETIQHASADLIGRVLPVLDDLHSVLEHKPAVFFSSRRRHTRLQGDWSSDVCSSD